MRKAPTGSGGALVVSVCCVTQRMHDLGRPAMGKPVKYIGACAAVGMAGTLRSAPAGVKRQ